MPLLSCIEVKCRSCFIKVLYISSTCSKRFKKVLYEKDLLGKRSADNKYIILENLNEDKIKDLKYPIIVKPVDAYSSCGVCKVNNIEELRKAFDVAVNISRTKTAIVEEVAVDGGFGWWCESNDVEKFTAAVELAMNEDIEAMGQKGFEY